MYMCLNIRKYKSVGKFGGIREDYELKVWFLDNQICFRKHIENRLNMRGYRKQIRGLVTIHVCVWVGLSYGL